MAAQGKPEPIEGVDIRYEATEKLYLVSIDVSLFMRGNHDSDLFIVWLLSRWQDETIIFSFNQTYVMPVIENYLTLLNAIAVCDAHTVARVDHIHEDLLPFFVFSCDDMLVSDFGMLQLSPIVAADKSTELPKQLAVAADFGYALWERMVLKGVIKQEEYVLLRKGTVVFLTPKVLKERTS